MLLFLKEVFDANEYERFLMISSSDFTIKNRNAKEVKNIKQYQEDKMINKSMQSTY